MVNTKLDKDFIMTLAGAGVGGSALSGEGDILGGALGLGIGAAVGANLNIDIPNLKKSKRTHMNIELPPIRSEVESMKEELMEIINKNKEKDTNKIAFNFLSNDSVVYDSDDPFKTITNNNIEKIVRGSKTPAELKVLATILKNKNELSTISLDDFSLKVKKNVTTHFQPEASKKSKITSLSKYFQSQGYSGDALEKKLNLFSNLITDKSALTINKTENTVSISNYVGGESDARTSFKISTNHEGAGGISSHVDGKTYAAIRNVNPFAKFAISSENYDGKGVAQAIGINFADASKEEAIANQIEDMMKQGGKPEDVKAVLRASQSLTENQINSMIETSYQNLEYESGFVAKGVSAREIEQNIAGDLARRTSRHLVVDKVIGIDRENPASMDRKSPIRSLSSLSKDNKLSESFRYQKVLSEYTGRTNVLENTKADNTNVYSLYSGKGQLNALAPAERNQSINSSRTNPVTLKNKNSVDRSARAFDYLKSQNYIPAEYSTATSMSRLLVDRDKFNKASSALGFPMNISIGDGSALGRQSVSNDYSHTGFKAYKVSANTGEGVHVSEKLKEVLDLKTKLSITPDSHKLLPDADFSHRVTAIEELEKGINTSLAHIDSINKQPKSNENLKSLKLHEGFIKTNEVAIKIQEKAIEGDKKRIIADLNGKIPTSSSEKAALENIIISLNSSSKEGLNAIKEYKKATETIFSANEFLGINVNGKDVKLSKEFEFSRLIDVIKTVNGDHKGLELIFEVENRVGRSENTKSFATDGKFNISNLSDLDFKKAVGLGLFLNNTGFELEETDSGQIFKRFNVDTGAIETKSISEARDEIMSLGDDALVEYKQSNSGKLIEENKGRFSIVADLGDSGQNLSKEIMKIADPQNRDTTENIINSLPVNTQLKKNLNSVLNNELVDGIAKLQLDAVDENKAYRAGLWSLAQLANASTEGKASGSSVMNLSVQGLATIEDLADTLESPAKAGTSERRYAENFIKDVFGYEDSDFKVDPDDFRTKLRSDFLTRVDATQQLFSLENIASASIKQSIDSSGNVVISKGEVFEKEHFDMFRLAYTEENSMTLNASPDIDSAMRTGSGTERKNMSHNAQEQFSMNGYTKEQLGFLGEHDPGKLYDLEFTNKLSEEVGVHIERENTLNSFLDTKTDIQRTKFINALEMMEPNEVQDFLIAEKVPERIRNQDYLHYAVENKNKAEINLVPIYKKNTTKVGTYIADDGSKIYKPLKKDMFDVIKTDMEASMNPTEFNIEKLESAASNLHVTTYSSLLSQNNPQLKDALSLVAPNSSYSVSMHGSNEWFDGLVERYGEGKGYEIDIHGNTLYDDKGAPKQLKGGRSIVGISEEKAVSILQGQGVNVKDVQDLRKNFLSSEGLLLTDLSDSNEKVRLTGFQVREPAPSGFSVRDVMYAVISKDKMGSTSKDYIWHSEKDLHYKHLMFGDFDLDHTLNYNYTRKLSSKEHLAMEAQHVEVAKIRNKAIDLGSKIGIKNKDRTAHSIFDAMDVVDSLIVNKSIVSPDGTTPITKGSQVYFDEVKKVQDTYLETGARKGGFRKTLSPGITQLSTNISASIFNMETLLDGSTATFEDKHMMRTMNHHLIENLLKMGHESTSKFRGGNALDVEDLIDFRNKLSKGDSASKDKYTAKAFEMFRKMFKDNMDAFRENENLIKSMIEYDANSILDPSKYPTNPMDTAKFAPNITGGTARDSAKLIQGASSSQASTGINKIKLNESTIDVANTMKAGYNELLTTAKRNLVRNKIPLLVGSGALALGALVTQKDPNFQPSHRAKADIGSMMLAPNVVSQEQSKASEPMLERLGHMSSNFVAPEIDIRSIKKSTREAISLRGSYYQTEENIQHSMKEAIFGENISNVRIERNYD